MSDLGQLPIAFEVHPSLAANQIAMAVPGVRNITVIAYEQDWSLLAELNGAIFGGRPMLRGVDVYGYEPVSINVGGTTLAEALSRLSRRICERYMALDRDVGSGKIVTGRLAAPEGVYR